MVVAGLDGSHPVVISNGLAVAESAQIATAGSFTWSPDSLRLAFTRQVSATIRTIDVVAADGSHLTQLLPDSIAGTLDRYDPKWSPDGQWIAFFSTDAAGSMAVNLIRPDGTDERRLPTSAANPAYAELSWDPDPARNILEFVSGDEVKVFDVATAKETSVGFGFWASWAPDARHISWWDASPGNPGASTAGGIQIAQVDQVLAGQGSHVPLFPGSTNGVCYSRSGTGICAPAQWSPDSRWIFGPDPTGTSIVFSTLDIPATVRTIMLDHAADLSNGPQGTLAWQAIAP
jgi:hypothetical protein